MTIGIFFLTAANRFDYRLAIRSLLRVRLAGKPQTRGIPWASDSPSSFRGTPNDALFTGGAAERDGGAIFPIRSGVAFVAIELAKLANLSHRVGALLILPLVVAGAGQRLLLLRQDRVIDVDRKYNPS
jgi:hypothetical protein